MACLNVRHNELNCWVAGLKFRDWCSECKTSADAPHREVTELEIATSKPLFRLDDRQAVVEVLEAAFDVVMDADLVDGELYGKLVDPDKVDRLEKAIEAVHRV